MNWMKIAMELTRQAMGASNRPEPEPQRPMDLGEALTQQFSLIDRNMDTVVRMVNAQNQKLDQAMKRQQIWNWCLAGGIVVTLIVAILGWVTH